MTVVVYQGENAEEKWREDVSCHSWLRHPNPVQLFATASSPGIHATLFRDELIPAQKMIDEYSSSHFKAVFLWNLLVRGYSWDEHVYNGTRQFYQAKGFDPDSQDVARKLGFPLFNISTELDGPFARKTDVCDHRSEIQNIPDSEVLQDMVHGESGLHFLPDQRVASSSAPAHQIFSFDAHAQGSAIDESFDPRLFEFSAPSARSNKNFSFEFPFHDQPYLRPSLEPSDLFQFAQPDIAGSGIHSSGASRAQSTVPPPSLWTSFPRLPPSPSPTPPPRPPNFIAAHLDHLPANGSVKRKSGGDDPADDIDIHARRPRKIPTRSDLWGV
ncbi:hypothetical protein B0H17DRAFT_1213081 [Mycena rosella]|uniref:Uncharacterized protein n=1 Tax=Mycena rosella TaxID=1033263 RepID=A0AAD7CR21_MYCRO|nr:hypothetical protein B0H17DRAFT_1213081 [Mycena rosella]